MRRLRLLTLVCTVASCRHGDRPRGAPAPVAAPVAPASDPVTCATDEDCVVSGMPDATESDGGPCCPACDRYEALNRRSASAKVACDAERRGACSIRCTTSSAGPPVARCVARRCLLDYPPVDDRCRVDTDCAALPKLATDAPGAACGIACGEYVVGNRAWASWAKGLWQNPSVTGTCPTSCVVQPFPDGRCASGRCTLSEPAVVRVRSARTHTTYVSGALTAAQIDAVLAAGAVELQRCEERRRRIRPTSSWTFGISFVIDADGHVVSQEPNPLASALPDIAACIDSTAAQWTFPRPAGGTVKVNCNLVLFF